MRKDKQGRNTAYKLGYYDDFVSYKWKGYLNCNIHERIAIRTAYCGNVYPTLMIKEIISDQK